MGPHGALSRTDPEPVSKPAPSRAALSTLGYDEGAIDGLAGPATRAAIDAFQRNSELAVTGHISAELVWPVAARSGAVLASEAGKP